MRPYYLTLFLALSVVTSCSVMQNIKRTQYATQKIAERLYQKNGNAFYLSSTYSTFSVIWTYKRGRIEVMRINNGRTRDRQSFSLDESRFMSNELVQEIDDAINTKIAIELDGDYFGFLIEAGDSTYDKQYGVGINDMIRIQDCPLLLSQVIDDIKVYDLWTFK